MKIRPKDYAVAFVDVYEARVGAKDKASLISRFIALVRKNGDWHGREKIISEIEDEFRAREGGRKIIAEFARKSALPKFLKNLSAPDTLVVKTTPELVAGIRITINGKREADFSLKRKLNNLFS